MPVIAKKNAIPLSILRLFSGYKINAADTGIINDILFANVVIEIPAFCIPYA